jgi:hypothetical protein
MERRDFLKALFGAAAAGAAVTVLGAGEALARPDHPYEGQYHYRWRRRRRKPGYRRLCRPVYDNWWRPINVCVRQPLGLFYYD